MLYGSVAAGGGRASGLWLEGLGLGLGALTRKIVRVRVWYFCHEMFTIVEIAVDEAGSGSRCMMRA